MSEDLRGHLSFGLTVVALLLWFMAFVALLRGDLGRPLVTSTIFVVGGAVSWLIGSGIRLAGRRRR